MSGRPKEYDDTAVIDAAMDVFWTNGFEASSTQELCERTGLGRGSLYHAFGSKQNLYEQALRRYQELGLKAQTEILNGPGTAKERLQALLQWGVDGDLDPEKRRSCMALFSVMERGSKDPVIDQINRAYVNRLEAVICHVIAVGQRNGELADDRPALEVARAFLASYYGLRILGQSMPDRAFLSDVLQGTIAKL
ncbi:MULTISPECIES: TetR/AcrR family transcriptional regulator [Pseudomonadota]|uniref:Transcriptional regulator, TetR-family n=1 Tax=Bordetella petrii (strain ATCC BAA-461 / DSM 12804 / CCUG 43448 / CIP 107267 / Se-1111R) TaxID=340100 RepID=A9IEL0_BORPD|nr:MULTISPECIES: TetR/AcrR family transcriptional regulator [Pseudomonadota]CAP41770.1 transcriptional regulator, TetR-family [Bordetella petrii]HCK4605798.1 TetR/AcrR family transcriptional regulator [Pseudomonas aeruginosa]